MDLHRFGFLVVTAIWLGITKEHGAWLGWSKASRAMVVFSVQRSAGGRG
jgi:hypothetical protein